MVRIELNLPDEQAKELEALLQKTKLATRADVINNALTLFEWAVETKAAGRMVASLDAESGTARELVMEALENVPAPVPAGRAHAEQ